MTLAGVDNSNPILKEIWHDVQKESSRPESKGLRLKIFDQIKMNAKPPEDSHIPPHSAAMEYDHKRFDRVIWKIIRGLFFIESSNILSENISHFSTYYHGRNLGLDPPEITELLNIVRNQNPRGEYQKLFSYKYVNIPITTSIILWALLFWNRHLFIAFHHEHNCRCEKCQE